VHEAQVADRARRVHQDHDPRHGRRTVAFGGDDHQWKTSNDRKEVDPKGKPRPAMSKLKCERHPVEGSQRRPDDQQAQDPM
jgi:hypothetical protein